jgi:hypothetical protein
MLDGNIGFWRKAEEIVRNLGKEYFETDKTSKSKIIIH